MLKLPKNNISDQLDNLFNLSFMAGSFPTLLKTPIQKRVKINYTNYRPISVLANFDKILKTHTQ